MIPFVESDTDIRETLQLKCIIHSPQPLDALATFLKISFMRLTLSISTNNTVLKYSLELLFDLELYRKPLTYSTNNSHFSLVSLYIFSLFD